MTVQYEEARATLSDVVGVEAAEPLLAWLQNTPEASVDLGACTHLHAANLQVLMVAKPLISAWPTDTTLSVWLEAVLAKRA
jgi:hypothetical protein